MRRGSWPRYVTVAERREQARKKMEKLRKKGMEIQPILIEGRTIARTFWGKAWCDHLESYSDFENRLPRGRTYVRNGSVCHLGVESGEISAIVSGTTLYTATIAVKPLAKKRWDEVKKQCSGQIGSLLELLQGKFSTSVMAVVTDKTNGLFPAPAEISFACTCPDWADMCKHVAASLYGVGARLDENPEMLFLLRGVDHQELISVDPMVAIGTVEKGGRRRIADDSLSDVFGIDLSEASEDGAPDEVVVPPVDAPPPKPVQAPRSGAKHLRVTGKAVASLRKKFGMSRSQFARLLRVSAGTVSKWEKQTGTLRLRAQSIETYGSVRHLTKRQAWTRLDTSVDL